MPHRTQARSEVSGVSSPTRASDSDASICMAGPACIHGQLYFRRTPCATSSPARACELLLPTHRYKLPAATHRRRFFSWPLQRAAFFIAALQEDAALPAWVLMPDHVHWLVQLGNVTPLARVVSCMKTASTRAVNQQRWVPAAVWARAYHDRGLRKETICAAWLVTSSPIRYAPDWSSGSAIPHSGM